MDDSLRGDLVKLGEAMDAAQDAARAESVALWCAENEGTAVALARLRAAHLDELDKMQALLARLELLRRRFAQVRDPPSRTAVPAAKSAPPKRIRRSVGDDAAMDRPFTRGVVHGAGDVDYDLHGASYTHQRRADPRIERQIHDALGDARTVLNVGAGAGSYEPTDRQVVAVEPSAAMRAKRTAGRVPAIDAVAEELPFDDDAFDAAMATITVHQWQDLGRGLGELRRVTRGPVVVMAFDPAAVGLFWLMDYIPEMVAVQQRRDPAIASIAALLGGASDVRTVPVASDCTDGFTEAFYARPEAFLDAAVRGAQSTWNFIAAEAVARCTTDLARDLADGVWNARYEHWRRRPFFEGSLRLIVNRR